MSIEINKAAVNAAGEDIIVARAYFMRGDHTGAAMRVKQARAKLYQESKWCADGQEQVQEWLNFVIGLDQDLMSLRDVDLSTPAAMFYWGRESWDEFLSRMDRRAREAVLA